MHITHAFKHDNEGRGVRMDEPYYDAELRDLEQQIDRGDARLIPAENLGFYTHRVLTGTGAEWLVFAREVS